MALKAILKGRPISPMKRASSLPGLKAKVKARRPVSPKKSVRGRGADKKSSVSGRGNPRPKSPTKPPRDRGKKAEIVGGAGDDPYGDAALAAAIAESAAAAGVNSR